MRKNDYDDELRGRLRRLSEELRESRDELPDGERAARVEAYASRAANKLSLFPLTRQEIQQCLR